MNQLKSYFIILVVLFLSLGLVTAVLAATDYGRNPAMPVPEPDIQPAVHQQGEKLVSEMPTEERVAPLVEVPPGFEAVTPQMILGAPGDWDGLGVRYPMVLQDSGVYKMWYTGYELSGPERIGYATSPDGLNWTKHAGNPVLETGSPVAWDADGLEAPFVIQESPTSYKMWYSGSPDCAIGYATSSDGISWTKHVGNPVLSPGGEVWNNNCVLHPFVLFEGGVYKMWLLTTGDDGGGEAPYMAYATSPDGINWTWDGTNPLFGPTWEGWFWRPDVLSLGGSYYMWYSVWDGEGHTSFATAPDEVTWTKHGSPILSGTPGEWDEGTAIDPFVIESSGTYTMWYDNGAAIGVVTSTNGIDWTKFLTEPVLSPGQAGVFIDVNYAHDWVEGHTGPNESYTVTLSSGGELFTQTGQADGNGWFGSYEWPWTPNQPNISTGDIVTTTVAGGTAVVNPIGAVYGELDFDADTAFGTIEAPWFSPDPLTVRCDVWVEFGPPPVEVSGVDPDGGSYLCDFSTVGWDLQPGHTVAIRYIEPDGDSVMSVFEAPWMRVNYGHDWVGGNYPLGHTFWITVTDNGGAVKASAQLDTQPGAGWGGDGFDTQWWQWSPNQPDIQPDDWVYFQADDGYLNTMLVGDISGTVDLDNDSVSGPILADWFTQTLDVECHPWGAPGPAPMKNSTAEPDGSSPYFCQWDPSTEWDILPGQDVAAMYLEPDLDRVINVFRYPAPDLRVEKWAEGSGQAQPGGPAIFTIRYTNDGDDVATTINLTDTLPINTAYLTDTSGVTPDFGPGWAAWTLGPLAPGEWAQFQLVLTNTANPGDGLHNEVDVSTAYDFNFDNNHAEADVLVVDELPDLYVNKDPIPGDPAPGQTMLWEINYGNNSPVASGPIVLTDTLPFSTSVVSWYSENGYNLWTDVSISGDELVLEAPSVPGNWGDRLLLQLMVDADVTVGTQLTNTVAITTAGDTNPDDNWHQRDDVWVNGPRWDGHVDKNFGWGNLIPGGQVAYDLHVRNFGNMAAQTWITDTLPDDTSFAFAWLQVGQSSYPFPPDYLDENIAAWNLGTLEPGEWVNFNVQLDISDMVTAGTTLTNCAEITIDGDDSWAGDNVSCVADMLNEPGPNLRIKKSTWWNWEGSLHYDVKLENLGTTTAYSVTITDTLPVSTTFSGGWSHNWSPDEVQFTDLGDQLVWTLNRIEPAQNWDLSFDVDLDGNIIGVPGLAFTNTVEVPIPNDVYPADNEASVTAVTGPDIYINKWLSDGIPRPGEIVTFTIEFGNQNQWPWWAAGPTTITDVLPAEMTFITATAPWNPNETWPPTISPDNELVWDWGEMCPDCWWQFDLVVQISDTAEAWTTLTNTVEIRSDNPSVEEKDYGNNTATAAVTILHPQFIISKGYEGSEIAGMPITYTLMVTNTGTWDDTGLIIHDVLPENVEYTTGGTYDPGSGVIEWTVASLAQTESTAVSFSGVLACTANASVLNDVYQVADSDEGISSPLGPPVSFNILAPTLVAAFDQSTNAILVGEDVTFTSNSTTNGIPIVSWEWSFGDGSTSTGQTALHSYDEPGVYDVTLTITDSCGFSETLLVTNAVIVEQTGFNIYLPFVGKD